MSNSLDNRISEKTVAYSMNLNSQIMSMNQRIFSLLHKIQPSNEKQTIFHPFQKKNCMV